MRPAGKEHNYGDLRFAVRFFMSDQRGGFFRGWSKLAGKAAWRAGRACGTDGRGDRNIASGSERFGHFGSAS